MTSNIYREVRRFKTQKSHLKRLLKETRKTFNYIGNDETIRDYLQHSISVLDIPSRIPVELDEKCQDIIDRDLCIIVFGQTHYAKCIVINEIFRKTIMPINIKRPSAPWRMAQFRYGPKDIASLCVAESAFDLGDCTNVINSKESVNEVMMIDDETEQVDSAKRNSYMEVVLNHSLLGDGMRLVMTSSYRLHCKEEFTDVYTKASTGVLPIFIYAFERSDLNEWNVDELQTLREVSGDSAFFFVRVPTPHQYQRMQQARQLQVGMSQLFLQPVPATPYISTSLAAALDLPPGGPPLPPTELGASVSRQTTAAPGVIGTEEAEMQAEMKLFAELCKLGFLSSMPRDMSMGGGQLANSNQTDFTKVTVESELIMKFEPEFSKLLIFVNQCIQRFLIRVLSLFVDLLARCLQGFIMQAYDITHDLMVTPKRLQFAQHQEYKLYATLVDQASSKQEEICSLIRYTVEEMQVKLPDLAAEQDILGSVYKGKPVSPGDYKLATGLVRSYVLREINKVIAERLLASMEVLHKSFVGTLERTVASLEKDQDEGAGNNSITEALKSILEFTYGLDVPFKTSASFVHTLLEKMKELMQTLPWQQGPLLDAAWKRRVAKAMLDNLSNTKITKEVCTQISGRLRSAHDTFQQSLRRLETQMEARTNRWEEAQERIKRHHAPRLARHYLEATSLRDYVRYGMPTLGKEIGRGQYGVVYTCTDWGPCRTVAVKSVVPPDDKHWSDLALEFYYSKQIPEHDRIVSLRGSVIDFNYSGGASPAVLLIMDRLIRDLYVAIKQGMDWSSRLRVAVDVVEGIRFLHGQGLIHRDIKLKNVLLDSRNRGKLTDLGFCKPHAMMSGSIVGTPIHMAPELFEQKYNFTVDIYAFGILFWYVCAGRVRLPYNFEQCSDKDMLWQAVRRGVRPERLVSFDDECWELMQRCWHKDSSQRPHPGELMAMLTGIHDKSKVKHGAPS